MWAATQKLSSLTSRGTIRPFLWRLGGGVDRKEGEPFIVDRRI